MRAVLLLVLLLAGCASSYDAASTYDKLHVAFPGIRIASDAVPASVTSVKGIAYSGKLQLDLYLPAQRSGMPGIVLVHGGGWRSGTRENLAPMAIRMAQRGYASATISYRLSGEAKYPAALEDVKAAVRWMREQGPVYGIDPDRIAVAGGSAGGQLASLAGVTSDGIRAVVNIDGLSDFTSEEALRYEDDPAKTPSAAGAWFGGRYAEQTALWRAASPTFHVSANTPPILFIGSAVPRFSAGREAMVEKMKSHGVASRVLLMPDTPHSFWLFDPWLEPTVNAMSAFLDEQLRANQYRNPVLHADYSDPDAIRVGDTFHMISSSFSNVPGLPLLQSQDLVNWELVGHALPQLVPHDVYATHQPGKGVWAPSLRHHAGKFWIFYPDPDFGIYVITAERFAGPWSKPHLLLAGKGLIDPTPLWDDDGKAWLMHAWAKSRAGFNNVLTLHQMAPDARMLLDAGKVVIDGDKLPGYRTLEGPKFYKQDGYYYVFAPAGGVEQGWQSVFRSRSIDGPYEDRIVLRQGSTAVNGPHQGAWVRAQDGKDWFLHFQDKRAYGRVVHLQPMQWKDGWPVIGDNGQPVAMHARPVAGLEIKAPAMSDEFSAPQLGFQWQWNANWKTQWYGFDEGRLRLFAQPDPAPILSQKLPAESFRVDAKIELHAASAGDQAGLILSGTDSAWIGVRDNQLVLRSGEVIAPMRGQAVYLRMDLAAGVAQFSYSFDNATFAKAGKPFSATMGRWVGAQMGLFCKGKTAVADVDYFRVTVK